MALLRPAIESVFLESLKHLLYVLFALLLVGGVDENDIEVTDGKVVDLGPQTVVKVGLKSS